MAPAHSASSPDLGAPSLATATRKRYELDAATRDPPRARTRARRGAHRAERARAPAPAALSEGQAPKTRARAVPARMAGT